MKKLFVLSILLLLAASAALSQGARIATAFNYPLLPGSSTDTILWRSAHVRGCSFSADADADGKSEIAITSYTGRVHVFKTVGNDSIRLVWTSPPPTTGGNSTVRSVIFGDLDNDGRQEVIFQVSGSGDGIYIYEWDGVPGSANFGTSPSQLIAAPPLSTTLTTAVEYMEVADVDGDNQPELLVTTNGPSTNDHYYVISAVGGWDTNNPGFSSFEAEFDKARADLAKYNMFTGTPYSAIPVNFDGTGNKEILLQCFYLKGVSPVRVPASNTYLMADTTNNKQNFNITGSDDCVSLFGGAVYDIDRDGREEVYLANWYGGTASANSTKVHMVFYNSGSNTKEIDSTNVAAFDLRSVTGDPDASQVYSANTLGYGYGDLDGNGKPNIYFSGIYFSSTVGFNIVSMEYQGGDKRDPANWKLAMEYRGEPSIVESITYRDSLGRRDTITVPWAAQVAHMYGRNTDFDKDGKQDLLMPMQGWFTVNPDSVTTRRLTWNQSASKYDTVTTRSANPKRWVFRILEGTGGTGVEAKELTVITPDDFVLHANYPNPFNPSTNIRFSLPVSEKISLVVYDMLGREVRSLIGEQVYQRGTYEVTWDGTNNSGRPVASGNYVYTLRFGNYSKSGKMMLLK